MIAFLPLGLLRERYSCIRIPNLMNMDRQNHLVAADQKDISEQDRENFAQEEELVKLLPILRKPTENTRSEKSYIALVRSNA